MLPSAFSWDSRADRYHTTRWDRDSCSDLFCERPCAYGTFRATVL